MKQRRPRGRWHVPVRSAAVLSALLLTALGAGGIARGSFSWPLASASAPTTTSGSSANGSSVASQAERAAAARQQAIAAAAGASVPVGDLPGWHQTFSDDFTTPLAAGRWATSPYAKRWLAYDGFADTFKVGQYDTDTLSVANGDLDMHWSTVAGKPRVSGLVPLVGGTWGGQTYGRYSVRFRADAAKDYEGSFLLWPDSNDWGQGEADFVESYLDGKINAFNHCPGANPSSLCGYSNTTSLWTSWHVATVEWTPAGVAYYLDGVKLLTSSKAPTGPMHLVLQGFAGAGVTPTESTTVQVDWVSIWSYDAATAAASTSKR